MANFWQRVAAAPFLSSGFRPFYLLGALYAPLVIAGGAGALSGWVDLEGTVGRLWHAHEMLFGFATAIVVGTLLTALPSWAGTPEIRGLALLGLASAWLAGRVAFWVSPWLGTVGVMALDLVFYPALLVQLTPALWRAPNRLYRLVAPILVAMAVANLAYHASIVAGDAATASRALRGAVWTLVALYTLKGGVLTPIFTGNALRELGRGDQARFVMPLEAVALMLLVALAACDLAGAPRLLTGTMAAACALVQGVRVARWRGWRVADQPLLPSMHLGFAWLLLALVLKALADLGMWAAEAAWLHAFTLGALGMMMLGLMTRVSLRHTGRELMVPATLRAAAVLVCVACALRLAATGQVLGPWAIGAAAIAWALAFVAYLERFTGALISPSLPRDL